MPKRFVDTDIWEKEWFMSCTPTEKCLVIQLTLMVIKEKQHQ